MFFIASVKLLQFLRLLQKLLLYYYYSNVFRKNATKKITCENCEKQTKKKTFSDGIKDVQLGRFILLSVPISQQLPRLTSLSFFSFLK